MLGLILSMITPTMVMVFVIVMLLTYYVTTMPRMLNMPPGPLTLPIIGNFLELRRKPTGNDFHPFQTLAREYGKLVSLKIGNTYTVIISDYKLLVEAFVKKSDAFSGRPKDKFYLMKYLNNELGAGVVTNDGHSWKQLRRVALMTMRDCGVGKQSLEEKIQEEIRILLDCFSQQNGQPFYTKPLLGKATSNVISGVIFGSRFDYEDPTFKELLLQLDRSLALNPIFSPINFFPFLRFIPYFRQIAVNFGRTLRCTTSFVKELTASNESTYDPDNIRDFVDLFIKTKHESKEDDSYNESNMCRVIVDLFTAGSDTTANTLSWAILYMANHPDVQERCQKEIDGVLGKSRMVSIADKEKLPYVEATMLEILRLRPAAPLGVIHCTRKDAELGSYNIPKDTIVVSNVLAINKDPAVFPEPEKFRPEHFLNEDGKIINRDRNVAFSIGPRSCLGEILARMELSLFFTSILQFYTIKPEPGVPVDLSMQMSLILRHKVQNVVITRRD